MASRPRDRKAAALFVAAFAVLTLPLPFAGAAPVPLAGTPVTLNMWLHQDYTMSMAGNQQETTPADSLTTMRTFVMPDGFQKDVCLDGVDIGSGRQGIAIELQVIWVGGISATEDLAFRLKDGATVLADGSFPLARPGGSQTFWNLNFTAQRSNCILLRGHQLALEVQATVANGTASATIANIRNAHLSFIVTDPILPQGHTENDKGPATLFYPNDIDGSREILVNGTLNNAFTDAFVAAVRLAFKDPLGTAIANATAALTTGNWSYLWSYPRSPPGTYSIDIQVEDTQGHLYNATTSFTFVAYGIRMTTQGAENGEVLRYTTPGICAQYDLIVSNIGGSATTATLLTETAPPPLWRTNFTRSSLALEPGASDTSTFNVCPDSLLGPGNSSRMGLLVLANDDPAPIKARGTLAATTVIEREIFLVIAPPSTTQNAKLGASATFDFTITNNGGLATDVTFTATAAPTGWTRDLTSDLALTPTADGWKLEGLAPTGNATLTLVVQAPASATPDTTFACTVTARSVENASAVATFVGTTHLVLGVEVAQTSLPVQPDGNPGDFIDFQFELRNTDPLSDHIVNPGDITVTEATGNFQTIDGNDGGSTSIAPPSYCCDAATSQVFGVTITLPAHARAGRYQFTLRVVYDGDESKAATYNFSLVVKQVTGYTLALDQRDSEITLNRTGVTVLWGEIRSQSNYPVSVDIEASIANGGVPETTWVLRVLDAAGAELPLRLVLQPGAVLRVGLSITPSTQSMNGEHRQLLFRMYVSLTGQHPVNLEPPVELVTDLDTTTVAIRMFQQNTIVIFAMLLLVVWAYYSARRALRGPPPPPTPPAKKPPEKPGGGGGDKKPATSAAERPKA